MLEARVRDERVETDGFEERRVGGAEDVDEPGRFAVVVDALVVLEDVGAPYIDVGRGFGAVDAVVEEEEGCEGGRRVVLPFSVATLLARVWPRAGLDNFGAVRFCARPPDVVGRFDDVLALARWVVEEAAGFRSLFKPAAGSRVEDARESCDADGLVNGALGGPLENADEEEEEEASLRAAGWRVEERRERRFESGEGFFLAVVIVATSLRLPLETARVVGRVVRGAGSRLGETSRWGTPVDEEVVEVEVVGRSVVEPCVGFRSERARASEEDMVVCYMRAGLFWLGLAWLDCVPTICATTV